MPLHLLLALAAAAPALSPPEVLVLPLLERPESDSWFGRRLTDLVAFRLREMGCVVRGAGAVEREALLPAGGPEAVGLAAWLEGRVEPEAPQASDPVTVVGTLWVRGNAEPLRIAGVAERIDGLAFALADRIRERLGIQLAPAWAARIRADEQPFLLHRFLGEAERDLARGEFQRAQMKFGRTTELRQAKFVPEAFFGLDRSQRELWSRGGSRRLVRDDLARAAKEEADAARRQKQWLPAIQAYQTFARFTSDRGFRWHFDRALDPRRARIHPVAGAWLLAPEGAGHRFVVDVETGSLLGRQRAPAGWIGVVGEDDLVLAERRLERRTAEHKLRWKLNLPERIRNDWLEDLGGFALARGEKGLFWIELGLGSVVARAPGEWLASGPEGVVAYLSASKELVFLRPGRGTPAWRSPLPERPLEARVVSGRVLFRTAAGLTLLDAASGQQRAGPLAEGKGPLLGAGRRFLVTGGEGGLSLFDILGGEFTARLVGPGPALAAYGSSDGARVVYASGDVLAYDREGTLLDRGRIEGHAFAVLDNGPLAPGPLVVSDHGLYAFGEVSPEQTFRDREAELALVELLAEQGELGLALDFLDRLAIEARSGIAAVETKRAEMYRKRATQARDPAGAASDRALAELAERRAACARDPSQSVPHFSGR